MRHSGKQSDAAADEREYGLFCMMPPDLQRLRLRAGYGIDVRQRGRASMHRAGSPHNSEWI
jgi:hypothetical protein